MVLPDALTYFFSILNDLDVEPATFEPHLGVIMHRAARLGDLASRTRPEWAGKESNPSSKVAVRCPFTIGPRPIGQNVHSAGHELSIETAPLLPRRPKARGKAHARGPDDGLGSASKI